MSTISRGAPIGATLPHTAVTDDARHRFYKDVPASRFGTTEVATQDGSKYIVPDLHYPTEAGLRMLLVPVESADKKGCAKLDAQIRLASGLKDDEPIFTIISLVDPSEHKGTWQQLAKGSLKPDRNAQHMSAYLGEGRTTSAPYNYRQGKLWLNGQPANVHVVSMDGVPQATLNRTLLLCDQVLNDGVVFPANYWEDDYLTIDLRTTLMFYRDWLLNDDRLKTDPRFATYCSEHKLIVMNTALNLPHNEQSFREVFGDKAGARAWNAFKRKFEKLNFRPFESKDETHFEPLWKRDGISPERLKVPTLDEYIAWDDMRRAGQPTAGFRPMTPTRGMAFASEREADLIRDFITTYCSFEDAGGVQMAAAMLAFCEPTSQRMGITQARFMELALPLMQKSIAAEARVQCKQPAWLGRAVRELREHVPAAMGLNKAEVDALVTQLFSDAAEYLRSPDASAHTRKEALAWLKRAALRDYVRARSERVNGDDKTLHYAPPAILHRVELGQHTKHPLLSFRTVATAMAANELNTK